MAERIGVLLPAVLKQAQQRHSALFTIQNAWGRLVGKPLAAHTRPVSLRHGRLVVYADHPGDSFVLSREKPALLERLIAATGTTVEDLVVRPGELPRETTPRRASPRTRRRS